MRRWAQPSQCFNAAPVRTITSGLLLVTGLLLARGGAATATNFPPNEEQVLPAGWSLGHLPGSRPEVMLQVLKRPALAPPTRYSVVVLPGSGCTGKFLSWR